MNEETPFHERHVVYTIPDTDRVGRRRDQVYKTVSGENLLLDVYLPPDGKEGDSLPGVLFIHGGPVSPERNMKESGQYLSWGKLAAASGLVGFTFNHRYHAPELLVQSAGDVVAAVDYVREQASTFHFDPNRLCLWTCSGGGPHICFALRDQPDYLRCLVIYYAILDVRPLGFLADAVGADIARQFSPVSHFQDEPFRFPIFMARAGLDNPQLNRTMDDFAARALRVNTNIEIVNHAQGQHGFDVRDDDERSRQIISRTLEFIQENA